MKTVYFILVSITLTLLSFSISSQNQFKSANSIEKSGASINYKIEFDSSINTHGLGFRIHYNSKAVRVADLTGCLSGLGDKFSSALVSCKDISDRGFVQIAIADLLKDNLIPSFIGTISFDVISSRSNTGIKVAKIDVAGAEAGHTDVSLTAY